jgi:rfaE bifunctional protein nucleotidyltransferase chain/domain
MDKLRIIKKKIIKGYSIHQWLSFWRFKGKTIVFTNGCFDILHRGHIEYLSKAADYGDVLIIGLNSDKSVKKLKGPGRPYQDQKSRALILASLQFVTAVILFNEETPYELIRLIQPDVLVKGGDYKPDEIVGFDIVKAKGGRVVTISYINSCSTSNLIEKVSLNK